MKIALIRKKYSDFGGAELYIKRLAEELADLGNINIHRFTKKDAHESNLIYRKDELPIKNHLEKITNTTFQKMCQLLTCQKMSLIPL